MLWKGPFGWASPKTSAPVDEQISSQVFCGGVCLNGALMHGNCPCDNISCMACAKLVTKDLILARSVVTLISLIKYILFSLNLHFFATITTSNDVNSTFQLCYEEPQVALVRDMAFVSLGASKHVMYSRPNNLM